ncbi:MAG TPA: hypothetical protein VFM02_02260 [Candidatus Paceibacterota bacterium]|nr:hypothetical protein [Candidatus Paceibacterota bacterium]
MNTQQKKLEREAAFSRGFTVIELFAFMGMTAMVLLIAYVSFSHIHLTRALEQETQNASAILIQARLQAMHSPAQNTYGVHLATSTLVFFKGDSYVPNDPGNIVWSINPLFQISEVALRTDKNDIVYLSPSGQTTNYGSFSIEAKKNRVFKSVIQIDQDGKVETSL